MAELKMNKTVKFFVEYGPIIIFFILYKFFDIFIATYSLLLSTVIALITSYLIERKVSKGLLITTIIVLLMGSLTIILKDENFIKSKPTIINGIFAAILFFSIIFKKPVLKSILGHSLNMPDNSWYKFAFSWGIFFVILAILNEIIWRNFSTDIWVNFKLFGNLILTVIFVAVQAPFLSKYMKETK